MLTDEPQGCVVGHLLFLIYINDLPDGIASLRKIFVDETLLFSKVNDKNNCNIQLNSDLQIISKWAFQWKMLFNHDKNKQAIEVCFSDKREKNYPPFIFNSTNVPSAPSQKHLGLILDSKLGFHDHIDNKI